MYLYSFILTLALCGDLLDGRVPNWVFFLGLALTQVRCFITGSCYWALCSFITGLLIALLLFPLFMIGTLGAGDIKMYMLLPALGGARTALGIIFLSFAIAALAGTVSLIRQGLFKERLLRFAGYLRTVKETGRIEKYDLMPSETKGNPGSSRIHMILPIFISFLLSMGGIN